MSKSFREIVAEVKTAFDIITYIEQSGVSLKTAGSNKMKGLCPFHNEQTPSFVVDGSFQNYRCFGCGASGDIISYVQETERLEFRDSVEKLAIEANIEINIEKEGNAIDYASIRACLKDTANFFIIKFRELPETHTARKQVLDRGLSLRGMRYGYAPDGKTALLKALREKGYSDTVIEQAGVCSVFEKDGKKMMFDFWTGRLMFIITDATGKPIGFSGRKLFDSDRKQGKYVNSSEGPLFHKSSVLFNHDVAKRPASETGIVYVAEGQFDVAAFVEAGLSNVVASSGTAFTKKQALICSRMVGEEGAVVFAFDGDEAGVAAAVKVFDTAPEVQKQAYVVVFPDGMDPCDYRLEHGNDAFVKFVENNKTPLMEFVLNHKASQFDFKDEVQVARYLETVSPILQTISSPVLKRTYIKKVALQTMADVESIERLVKQAPAQTTRNTPSPSNTQENNESEPQLRGDERGAVLKQDSVQLERAILQKVETNESFRIVCMMSVLAMYHRPLAVKMLNDLELSIPKLIKNVLRTITELAEDSPIIPELFNEVVLVEGLLQKNFFPFVNSMEEKDFAQQYSILREESIRLNHQKEERSYATKAMQVFSTGSNTIALMEEAIHNEPKRLTTEETYE